MGVKGPTKEEKRDQFLHDGLLFRFGDKHQRQRTYVLAPVV